MSDKLLEHKHMIVRAEVLTPPTEEQLVDWVKRLVEKLDMKILAGPISGNIDYMPGNNGPTCVCIIETSHIACHVWNDEDPALIQLDVYTCGKLDRKVVKDHLNEFIPLITDIKVFDREYYLEDIT